MTKIRRLLLLTSFFALPLAAHGAEPDLQFKDIGEISEWRADGPAIVYVKSKADQWYKVEMYEACMTQNTKNGVQFLTERGFGNQQTVNRVVVDHHICTVTSLSKVTAPSPTAKGPQNPK